MHHSISAILVAAGTGTRMQHDIPKQYIELSGKPVIVHSIEVFLESFEQVEIIVVVSKDFEPLMRDIALRYFPNKPIQLVHGGASRFESCRAGIAQATADFVMVHDAARPLINSDLLGQLYDNVSKYQNAIPAIAPVESVRMIDANSNHAVNRDSVRLVQTPQAFDRKMIAAAYACEFSPNFTDDASVWEASGHRVHLIEGLKENVKITTPQDLDWVHWIMQERSRIKD